MIFSNKVAKQIFETKGHDEKVKNLSLDISNVTARNLLNTTRGEAGDESVAKSIDDNGLDIRAQIFEIKTERNGN